MWLNTLLRGGYATRAAPPETSAEIGRGDAIRVFEDEESVSSACILNRQFLHVQWIGRTAFAWGHLFAESGHEDDDVNKRVTYARKRFIDWRRISDESLLLVPLYKGFVRVNDDNGDAQFSEQDFAKIVFNKLNGKDLWQEFNDGDVQPRRP